MPYITYSVNLNSATVFNPILNKWKMTCVMLKFHNYKTNLHDIVLHLQPTDILKRKFSLHIFMLLLTHTRHFNEKLLILS